MTVTTRPDQVTGPPRPAEPEGTDDEVRRLVDRLVAAATVTPAGRFFGR